MATMAAIKQTFFQECEEQLCELETGLLAIQDGDRDPEKVNAVFRAVHSIKGGAGAFNLGELVQFAHAFESVLDHLRAGRLAATAGLVKLMLRAADMLSDAVRAARDGTSTDAGRRESLANELRAIDPDLRGRDRTAISDQAIIKEESAPKEGEEPAFTPIPIALDDFAIESSPEEHLFIIRFKPKPELYAKANETALLMRELSQLGDTRIVCDFSGLPLLDELDPEGSYLSWTVELWTASTQIP